jgi:hypothetical protein
MAFLQHCTPRSTISFIDRELSHVGPVSTHHSKIISELETENNSLKKELEETRSLYTALMGNYYVYL